MNPYRRWKYNRFHHWTFCARSTLPWWARKLWPTLHYCIEWDDLVIDKTCPEFKHCSCTELSTP